MNNVNLIGRLTREPELRHTPGGDAVCQFSIAVDRAGDKEDDGKYGPGYFDVTVWGTAGENCAQYLIKGQQVGVNGRLSHHRWEGQDGTKRSKVEVIAGAYGVDFLAKPGAGRDDDDPFDPADSPQGTLPAADADIPF